MLKEEYINKLKLKHPNNFNKYDYSLLPNEFKSRNKVKIICNVHGIFEQRYDNHLNGIGCVKCSYDINKSNKEDFIIKSNKIHNSKYLYSKTNYLNAYTKVIITCKKHGDFLQQPSNHLNGSGCSKCGSCYKPNTKEFIEKSIIVHNDKYIYSKVDYKGSHTKIIITCPIHGDFLQRPSKHLEGRGCSKCSESKGEKYISQILDNLNIKYTREYRIDGYNYRYDFYLPEYNIYIEYHGEQHYKPVDYFGGKKRFNKDIKRDKIKRELIKRSSGLLIVLDYKLNTLDLIKDELLRVFTIIHPKFLSDKEFTKEYIDNSKVYLYNNGIIHVRK